MTQTEALTGIFPNATITLNGNRMIVSYQYRKGTYSSLEIKHNMEFAVLLREADGFSIACGLNDSLIQIAMVFDFPRQIGPPGIAEVISRGIVENRVFDPVSTPEVREFQKRMESDIAQKKLKELQKNPPGSEELAGFLQKVMHGNDHLYRNHSIASIDGIQRWKRLREIALSGVLPFDPDITEPTPRTSDTAGSAEILIENEMPRIEWKITGVEKEAFADCVEYTDPGPLFSLGIDQTGSELEIFFSVEVYDEK